MELGTSPLPDTTRHPRMRTRRARISAAVGVTLLAAAAVAISVRWNGPDSSPPPGPVSRPTPADGPLPTGAPPRLGAYAVGRTLYLGGVPQSGNWSEVAAAGDSATASPYSRGAVNVVVLFRHGVEVARVRNTWNVVLSPDGTKAAWMQVAPDHSKAALVERDMVTGREAGRLALDPTIFDEARNEEAWEAIGRVANDGTVSYGGVLVSHTWEPGTDPVDRPARAAKEFVTGFGHQAEWVYLAPDATWGAWLSGRAGQPRPGDVDPDVWRYDGVTVQRAHRPETRFTIALPISTDARGLTWESQTDLLVTVFDDRDGNKTHFLRCRVTDRQCEYAPTPKDG